VRDLESGVRVTCDVGYLSENLSLPIPLCSRLWPDVRDRQTSDAHHRLMPTPSGGGGITTARAKQYSTSYQTLGIFSCSSYLLSYLQLLYLFSYIRLSFNQRFFYRATLCVSAVFAVGRCPSVTLVDCIQTAEDIVELLSRPVTHIILVFLSPSASTQFQGKPLQQGRKMHGGGGILRFSTEIAVYLGNGTR